MAIDIFSLEPSVVSRDLSGKYIAIYGKEKIGKTSFAAQFPRNLVCGFEHGTNALSGVIIQDITSWMDFKMVVKQLSNPKGREMYDTITIDTVGIAWDMCTDYICNREGVDKIGDVPYGAGYDMVRKEFDKTIRKITQLGYGIIIICHPSVRIEGEGESSKEVISPDIPKRGKEIINRLVDIIAYIGMDEKGERWLYTRQTPSIMAGSRFKYLAPKIKLGYQELVDAIGEAIDEEAKNGGKVVDVKPVLPEAEKPDFKATVLEIKKIVNVLSGLDEETEEPHYMSDFKKIVETYLGKNKKVKDCDESQVDHLVLILDDLKDYVKDNQITIE